MSRISEKGFTLIEILAVITIISIVSLITIPVVNRVIQGTGDNIYKTDEKSLAVAAENYYMEKIDFLPKMIGDETLVLMEELIDAGYIKKIKDLKDKSQYCDGYVIVEKTKDQMYDYIPYIKCADDFITKGYYDTPPFINILGSDPVSIGIHKTYVDAGAIAIDAIDKDITANITIINTVNTSIIGTYTVTYNVVNSLGNKAKTVTRTVIVEE